jgi:hypothetical protein
MVFFKELDKGMSVSSCVAETILLELPFKNNNQLINKSINLRMFNKRLAHT